MKLRDRLIISFCIILFVPVLLFAGVAYFSNRFRGENLLGFFTADLGFSVLIILFFTAVILIAWIYGTIVFRINQLKHITENIKDGNLDFLK